MTNLPQTLADEAVDGLNALIEESDRFRDWDSDEIQTLIRLVEKLQKVDAREAFVRFGAIAAICGNVDDVFKFYSKAMHLPGETETKPEFWSSLGNVGLYGKAQEIGTWLLDPKRGFFQKVWSKAVAMGQILEVWNRLTEAKKIYPELSQVDFSTLESAATLMETLAISDLDVVSILDLMGEIQRAHRIMFSGQLGSMFRVMRPPEDPPYIYITLPMNASFDEIHAMNRELARLVVEKLPEGVFTKGIVTSFAKAYPAEILVAA